MPYCRDLLAAEVATGKLGSQASSCSALATSKGQHGDEKSSVGPEEPTFPVSCSAQQTAGRTREAPYGCF